MRHPEPPGIHPLLHEARQVLTAYLAGRNWRQVVPEERTLPSRGCFVSLKLGGRLRGCIGTVLPARPSLEEEVAENAVAAATRDPRFPPLRPNELGFVRLSLDLLTAPEAVASMEELDARRYGVLVRHERRLGVLLPDIPGVTSPQQQIAICLEKAGLRPDAAYALERFEVERYSE